MTDASPVKGNYEENSGLKIRYYGRPKGDRNSFEHSQLLQLRDQIIAYRRLDRQQSLPPQFLTAVTGGTQQTASSDSTSTSGSSRPPYSYKTTAPPNEK